MERCFWSGIWVCTTIDHMFGKSSTISKLCTIATRAMSWKVVHLEPLVSGENGAHLSFQSKFKRNKFKFEKNINK